MVKQIDKVICLTPTPGKQSTRIEKWKYVAVRRAILKCLDKKGDGVAFKSLPDMVKRNLTKDELKHLGSVSWYTTTVKLDLEVKGEIVRVAGVSPQRLLRN